MPAVSAETSKKPIAILVFTGASVRSKTIITRISEQFRIRASFNPLQKSGFVAVGIGSTS
jgi:hypothetical protein